jgi:hypothetical protein
MAKKMTIQEKAIAVIDYLMSDDLTADLEYTLALHPKQKPLIPENDQKDVIDKLNALYTIAHGANAQNSCYDVHGAWRADIEKRYRRAKRNHEI